MTSQELLIYGLACFRLSVLLSEDDGPWHIVVKLRSWLKREEKRNPTLRKAHTAEGAECIRCNSVWFALPIAAYALCIKEPAWLRLAIDVFLLAMALSAMAILFQRMFPKR